VDNVLRIYYINGNDIVTFNNQKGAVSYKIFLPGSAPAQVQDNTTITITTERVLSSIPATEYNNIITVTPKKDEIITKQDNKNNNNMSTKKQNNKKVCCVA